MVIYIIVLGIDPGYAILGWGVIRYEGNRFATLGHGAITTAAGQPFSQRLNTLYEGLKDICDKFSPQSAAVEQLYFTTNQKTAIAVAEARGVIMLALERCGIPLSEYTPLQVKQSVVGYGKAEKHQVMDMTKRILNLEKLPKPDDTADALAIAICHAHSNSSAVNRYFANQLKHR